MTGNRERAESIAYQLQHWRLQIILEKMIEFRLRVDSKITRAIAPLILECFSDCRHDSCTDFPYEDEKDADLAESWKSSLRDDMNGDRDSFLLFFKIQNLLMVI